MTDNFKIDASEDRGIDRPMEPPIGDIIDARLSRREALLGSAAVAALATVGTVVPLAEAQEFGPSTLRFREVAKTYDQRDHVAEGYDAQVLIRWGDPVLADAPAFVPGEANAAAAAQQFGYNNDFVGYVPLPVGSTNSENGLLFVNHEYTITNLMYPGLGAANDANLRANAQQAAAEVESHGAAVIEIRKQNGRWGVVAGSRYNRRITGTTPMVLSGPAAGHDLLKTSADPTGRRVLGTLNNCAGGWTPWGTFLTAEENFNGYFGGNPTGLPHAEMYRRYGVTQATWYSWAQHIERFNVERHPNECHRFGWIVEIDPYDPTMTPVKRTAMGRFKHEGANSVLNPDGRVVLYSGDDERNEYVYKFVTAGRYNPNDRAANRDLLDDGTLFVAKFNDDGTMTWIPMIHGQGPLTAANGFASQADVLIFTRKAADLLAATPMDRPEDVEPNTVNNRVYVILTNNSQRTAQNLNRANPRVNNTHGHIVEIIPPVREGRADHAATEGRWDIFLLAGRPGIDAGARYHRATTENGWLSCPDNCAFDAQGRIWIATDGAPNAAGIADAIYAADVSGPGRALTRQFYTAPTGAEICGPMFTPDSQTFFLAVQHPGEDPGSTYDNPSTRWPDFQSGMPPRPAVVAITKRGGGVIGS